jgi:hypothetical protein
LESVGVRDIGLKSAVISSIFANPLLVGCVIVFLPTVGKFAESLAYRKAEKVHV